MQDHPSAEIAWAAGLFEGEGSISVSHRTDGRHVSGYRMQLTMTDEDIVGRFALAVGCGTVREPRLQPQNIKPLYRWRIGGHADIAHVLTVCWPWLGARRRERAVQLINCWMREQDNWKKWRRGLGCPILDQSIQMPTDRSLQIAWAAGLFEAEGWFGTVDQRHPRGHRTARMVLTSTDLDVLQAFAGIVRGGYVVPSAMGRYGKKSVWRWTLGHAGDIRYLIGLFMPWLGSRRKIRASEVLEVARRVPTYGRNRSTYKRRPQSMIRSTDQLAIPGLNT